METYFEEELVVEGKFMTEQAMLDEGMTEILGLIVFRFAMVGEVGGPCHVPAL